MKNVVLGIIGCLIAVSYTHLDVYKRQVLYSLMRQLSALQSLSLQ